MPNDWARVRVDDRAHREDDVRQIARVVTRGRPDRNSLYPQVVRLLHDTVESHTREYAVEIYLSLLQSGGLPIACSMVVDVVSPQVAGADPDSGPAAFLATAGAGDAEMVELMSGFVPRVRRRRTATVPGTAEAVESEVVQYRYPIAGGGFVLLTFATPQLQLLEPLTALFDAVAGSFRWLP
ncbi:hypothetical protein [Blastococcus capsensis]|uniref:hypothetical protein n=1 Tax=Blastococcus capsensis TaxID=1564163 RepID=UPI0025408985|nr:hypothetical protein [Blastococcus capsensis]MDK3257883.1 hypothetical protein [Blastococcus capsensis]